MGRRWSQSSLWNCVQAFVCVCIILRKDDNSLVDSQRGFGVLLRTRSCFPFQRWRNSKWKCKPWQDTWRGIDLTKVNHKTSFWTVCVCVCVCLTVLCMYVCVCTQITNREKCPKKNVASNKWTSVEALTRSWNRAQDSRMLPDVPSWPNATSLP